jgi:hypothetical protein
METEFNDYIPLVPSENEEFFDGFAAYADLSVILIASLGIPSDLHNRNGDIYPSSVINKIQGELLAASHNHRYLSMEALEDIRAWSNLEPDYEEEEEFTKVNWKEEGF